ncbi:alpha/beta hydrolase family protein [Paenibacillus sp. y28]|uniref:alpha/beta hydrolase family protein n=1 Tax=Paenibacillus sp. y28 TaxID=3129110 RepID=UPI00301ADADA
MGGAQEQQASETGLQQQLRIAEEAFELRLGPDLYVRGEVRLVPEQRQKPVLVIVHGFKGFKDWGFNPYVATRFAQQGYAVVVFNFSCNGVHKTDFDELEKFAVNTYSREQADLQELMKHVTERTLPLGGLFDTERIALLGHSRGGANSIIHAAANPSIRAVVTWNSIADCNLFDEAFRQEVLSAGVGYVPNARTKQQMPIRAEFFEDLDVNKERYDIPAVLAGLSVPVLLLQGDQDSERLVKGNARLREAAPQHTYITIEGGSHTFGAVHPFAGTTAQLEEAVRLTEQFVQKHVSGMELP